jgi:hypothetical protein
MLKAVEPFCSVSLKPTKPLTLPCKLTIAGVHMRQAFIEELQLAKAAAMRQKATARRKVIISLPLKRTDAAKTSGFLVWTRSDRNIS